MCDTSQSFHASHWGSMDLEPWLPADIGACRADDLLCTVQRLRQSWAAADRALATVAHVEPATASTEALAFEIAAAQDLLLDTASAVRAPSLDLIAEKVELWLLSEPDTARPGGLLTAADRLILSIVADVRALAAATSKDGAAG